MALTDLGARRLTPPSFPAAEADPDGRIEALEAEIRNMRTEFVLLRDMITEREQKGRTLLAAYRDVIADLTNLFEIQRKENIKREESLRFFLGSIENRIREDIRNELGRGAGEDAPLPARRRGFWPFRRRAD